MKIPRSTPCHRALRALVAFAAALWMAVPASATSYVRMSDEKLLSDSAVVVEGRIVAVESAAGGTMPAVDYLVAVDGVIKGFVPASSLIVRVPGGVRPDGVGLRIWGAPRFAEDEEILLFLSPRTDGTFALHQFLLGAFHVETTGGQKIVRRRLDGAREVRFGGKAAVAPATPETRDHAAFRTWLADRVAGLERPADYFVDDVAAPVKFVTVVSTEEPLPFGCGSAGGHPVRWFDFEEGRPVTWRVHTGGQPGLDEGGLPQIQEAFRAWSRDPQTPVSFIFVGRTNIRSGLLFNDFINTIMFEDPNDEIGGTFSESGILAIGGPWFSCSHREYGGEIFHQIFEGDIITQDGVSSHFETAEDPASTARQLFAHELGHTLGLDHSPEPESLMRALIHDDRRGASFAVDDLAGAYYLYGRGAGDMPEIPVAPSELTARVTGTVHVELAWRDNSKTESNFLIERRRAGESDYRFVVTVPSGDDTFVDIAEPDTPYEYRVAAQNAAGRSRPSAAVAVRTPLDRRPRAPTDLLAAPLSDSRVQLSWQDNLSSPLGSQGDHTDGETSFVIDLRWADTSAEVPVDASDMTAVVLTALPSATRFTFRVRAVNAAGKSAFSNEAVATTFSPDVSCISESGAAKAGRLCLADGRFAVSADYENAGRRRPARARPVTGEAGLFWFFHPGNAELMVRTRELGEEGEEIEVAVASLSDLDVSVTVTDTLTGETRTLEMPGGDFCKPSADPGLVFPAAPAVTTPLDVNRAVASKNTLSGPTAPGIVLEPLIPREREPDVEGCERDAERLCLFGRFSAELSWLDPANPRFRHRAVGVAGPAGTGFFTFDGDGPDVVVKMLDARALSGRFWFFADSVVGDFSLRLTVADTVTGVERIYEIPVDAKCGVADLSSFVDTAP